MMAVVYCSFRICALSSRWWGLRSWAGDALANRVGLVENAAGFGIISTDIHDSKTRGSRFNRGSRWRRGSDGAQRRGTVLRARERSTATWREPFSAEVGVARAANGFELTLTKCEMGSDTLVAEWTCNIRWMRRQTRKCGPRGN